MNKSIYIISGESSGDVHGGNLVKEIKKLNPQLDIYCWGGERMQQAGAILQKHYKELAFMGFVEVAKNIFTILRNFKEIKADILAKKPEAVVLIDYPGFNLRLAKWLKKNHFKVIYYIAPQAWAWKEGRVKDIKKYTDELLVILPFEEDFFKKHGIKTTFVGHPLLQEIDIHNTPIENKIALLPGSRKQEVSAILPIMLQIQAHYPHYTFQIAGMSHLGADFYKSIISNTPCEIVWNNASKAIEGAKLALVSSGTATLETALLKTPQIVCYKSSRLNYEIGKRIIKVPYISLVNLIMEREIVKELIQSQLNPNLLKIEIDKCLDAPYRTNMLNEYEHLRKKLGEKNASKEAATIILSYLK
jgi:lipid-A-disaccharide synthase